jgi:RNA recognition motif-containing protein
MLIGLLLKEGGNLNIHVGNLAREVTEEELRQAFEPFGQVAAVTIIRDRHNSVSRGFGFVEMSDNAEAQAAIESLNMKDLAGRTLDISETRPPRKGGRDNRPYGGGGGGRPVRGGRGGKSGGGRRRPF